VSELLSRVQAAVGNGYRVERELGGGGMSRVFVATETALGRSVVIKLLAPELTNELLAERFRREFQVTAVLGQHPHILPVLSTGTNDGLLYFITPFIEGETLRHRLRREGRLPVDDVVRILAELGSALAFAHERGIVHRDVKPENVLLSNGHAILADFGISAVLMRPNTPVPDGGDTRLTEHGMAVGTPGYMSPEQAAGESAIDGRSDLYSLGVIGYEMLTGSPPFTGSSPMEVMSAHLNSAPRPVESLRHDTPRPLASALRRILAKRPEDRFQTADAFITSLGSAWSGRGAAYRSPTRRWPWIAAAALLLAIAGYARLAQRDAGSSNPDLVAVAPFEVVGPELGVWREGFVDLISNNLDGAGPLRSVPPTVVLRRAPSRMDRDGARELAARTGAGITIFGNLVASGRDSVRASATIVETATGVATDVQLRDDVSHIDRLADSLSVAILRELGRTRAIGATRLASLGSSSLPALKAYLQGEQFYRRSDWDSAAAHYQRAIALDSTFAPALRHLSNALSWRLTTDLELSHDGYTYALRAGALNRGLTPRESLLVAADSMFAALQLAATAQKLRDNTQLVQRVTTLLDDGVRRFPDDPEMWFKFGDVQYHFTRWLLPSRSSMRSARDAFERAMSLDSAFAPAYIHQMELAAHDQDVDAMRTSAARYLALDPNDVHGRSVRLVQQLMDTTHATTLSGDSVVASAGAEVLQAAYGMLGPLMDSAETQVAMSRALFEAARAGRAPAALSREARMAYAGALLTRGHVAQSLALSDTSQWIPLFEASFLRAAPTDSASRLFDRWLADSNSSQRIAIGSVYWSLSGDTARLRHAMQLASNGRLPNFPNRLIPGLQAIARGDTAAAIGALTLPDSACAGWCWEARLPLAFLLSARKRDQEAAAVLDQDLMAWPALRVMWMLERGRVNERLGARPKAIDAYLYVANAWRHADPSLLPYVNEARRGLARLSSDPSRS